MEFLRDLFGSLTSGIIRLAVAVGVLAAAYFFIVRPVLDTTNQAIDTANQTYRQSFGPSSDFQKAMRQADRELQTQLHHAARQAKQHGDVQRLANCMQAAVGDVEKVRRCAARFGS
jgi:hypothetical protein